MSNYAIYNPQNLDVEKLPWIIGFNNGGPNGWYEALLIAEDGTLMGSHICSHEGYMPGDLGIIEGTRPDRHESFQRHYPDGYRMDFVGWNRVREDQRLAAAIKLFEEKGESADSDNFAKVKVELSDDAE